MDNGFDVDYGFNEAFSIIVNCENQQEADYFWDRLSAVPEAEKCGWVKDKFGVSWQIFPTIMNDMLKSGDRQKIQRVTEAFLKMKKFDLEVLQKVYDGD
ncbi:VOC family protein [Clostridium sp.]|uniref:VOC family protein n=1 Tax=Clostridium sp. TaxID=1506 RepID=UPI00283C8A8C|nr:VOC family protein [Clostridium sp.]MDR3594425.1 VOC family protein [Clostridium sp.]